ncbi:MAG: alpha-L-glutamate ligase-like protein [Acidobacteriota bacterium]|nr:alpha-L-glutamate ligase-like protein [Acidobacteriota bacterium]
MLGLARKLREEGVLGINRRNAEYITVLNPRSHYPLVDDKLRTKELALAAGMAVPELYGVISAQHEVRALPELVDSRERFVVKPAHGSGGNGILVITGRRKELYRKSSGEVMSRNDLGHHVSSTLSGLYSLGGQHDRVMIEYCVEADPVFESLSFQGVPDIRVIVLQGYPVMAMLRLPTRQSDGKANLHQGALGVGIDLATGTTTSAVQGNHPVSEHPDTGHAVDGLAIPNWREILELSVRSWEITGLGYLGVDVVIDRSFGPLMLELNARPGPNIQIANQLGLRHRLERVRRQSRGELPAQERIEFARQES